MDEKRQTRRGEGGGGPLILAASTRMCTRCLPPPARPVHLSGVHTLAVGATALALTRFRFSGPVASALAPSDLPLDKWDRAARRLLGSVAALPTCAL